MTLTQEDSVLVSILINNYNYSNFVGEAIDSALSQSYSNVEVIVVDDGSTDNSREVINSYSDKIIPIFKQNGGQTSAANFGFSVSRGDIICFLDSDDTFYTDKVKTILNFFKERGGYASNLLIYNCLDVVNSYTESLNQKVPEFIQKECFGNFYDYARKYKFIPFKSAPTSGLSISRNLAKQIFPLPEDVYFGLDDFIVRPSALIGEIYGVDHVLGTYRIHGSNNWHGNPYRRDEKFLTTQDKFLNFKLQENNKKPVISFFDSLFSREYYLHSGTRKDLFVLAFKVLRQTSNLKTLKFFLKTLLMAIYWKPRKMKNV